MNSSWITRTLCSVPSIVSLDTDEEGESSSASSNDIESPNLSFPTRERIRHASLSCGQHCSEICTPLEVEVGFDVGTSIEVQRVDTVDHYEKNVNVIDHHIILNDPLLFSQLESLGHLLCNGFDSWYGSGEECDDEPTVVEVAENNPSKQNRSINPDSRRKRIQKLQLNLDPFHTDDLLLAHQSMNAKYSPIEMNKRVYSFSSVDIKSPSSSCRSNFNQESNVLDISFGNACTFTRTPSKNLFDIDESEDDEEMCYDSDPGELVISGQRIARQRIPQERISNADDQARSEELQVSITNECTLVNLEIVVI
jgi:hypothetical protein